MSMDWSKLKVAVIGGGGFLGGYVVKSLRQQGCEPIVPRTADGWNFIELDNAARFFKEHQPQITINCAARQGGLEYQRLYPADIYYDNMMMGLNTLYAAQRGGVEKYINVVAGCSYPGYLQGVMAEDDYWSGPLHDSVINYGFTKKAQVVQGLCYQRQYQFNSIHLLMTNLYGPGEHFHPDRSHGLAALLLKFYEAKKNNQPNVTIWGSGKPVREWLFAQDAAQAIVAAADKYDQPDPINVSVGSGLTITDLAILIKDVVGYEGELVYDSDKPDGALLKTFANDRIKQAVGWEPTTSLRDGIAQTLAWLDANYQYAVKPR